MKKLVLAFIFVFAFSIANNVQAKDKKETPGERVEKMKAERAERMKIPRMG